MDVTQNTDNGLATAVVTWIQPTASDNSASVTLTSNHEPGEVFEIGITIVSYTATDPATNMITESFAITVEGRPAFIDIMNNGYLWLLLNVDWFSGQKQLLIRHFSTLLRTDIFNCEIRSF